MPNPPPRPNRPPEFPRRPPKIIIRKPGAPPPRPAAPPDPPPSTPPGEVRPPRWTFSPLGTACLIASFAITVLAAVLLVQAVLRYGLRTNFRDGLHLHDSNRAFAAVDQLKDALWWNAECHPARELLAKILTEAGNLDAAEREYRELLDRGFDRASVHAGLGVVLLRRAARTKKVPESVRLAEQAIARFEKAQSIPDGTVGVALAKLFIGLRTNDRTRLREARAAFEAIERNLENRTNAARITRAGLLDYYAGAGACRTALGEDLAEAWRFSRRAALMEPFWEPPVRNAIVARTRTLWEHPPAPDRWEEARPAWEEILREAERKTGSPQLYPNLAGPWLRLAMGIARMYARQGDDDAYQLLVDRVLAEGVEAPYARRLRAAIWSEIFDPSSMGRSGRSVQRAIEPAFRELAEDPSHQSAKWNRLRAAAYNDWAAAAEYLAVQSGGDRYGLYLQILDLLDRARRLNPDSYVILRNRILILHRLAEHEPDAGRRQARREEVRKALEEMEKRGPAGEPRFSDDWNKIRRTVME